MANTNTNGETQHRITGTLSLIQPFSGSQTEHTKIETFLSTIEAVAALDGWTQTQQCAIARLRLQPPARDFLESDSILLQTTSWETLKDALVNRFRVTETPDALYKQLTDCTQQYDEDVRSFAARIQIIGNKTLVQSGNETEMTIRRKLLQEQLLGQFTKGLRDTIKRFVMTHSPKTLADAIEIAKREELYANTYKM